MAPVGINFSSLSTISQIDLDLCFDWAILTHASMCSLSWWMVNLHHSLKSFAASKRFSSRIVLYLAPPIFPSALNSFPIPAGEKYPHSMLLPLTCFIVGMVCSE
ncbi:hypothetical protein AMECASPLE_034546 [Ameca splendens]|uniref:Uncharacterized protein n=1 Tax=Ameca splendens TaxID=208324 RepID=A0ABV0YUV2_9TELE